MESSWIKVTNSSPPRPPPRKPASDQGQYLHKGHLSQKQGTSGGSQEEGYCIYCMCVGGHNGEIRRTGKQQMSSHWLCRKKTAQNLICQLPFNRSTLITQGNITGASQTLEVPALRRCLPDTAVTITGRVRNGDRSREMVSRISEMGD